MTSATQGPLELLPCPFCGAQAEFERMGTRRHSCIVHCRDCGARHEGPDEDERSGEAWNRRCADQENVRLRAEVERLNKLAAAISRDCNDTANERNDLMAALARKDAVLEWYAERARSIAAYGNAKPPKEQAMLAIVTELMLDGGKRAAARAEAKGRNVNEAQRKQLIGWLEVHRRVRMKQTATDVIEFVESLIAAEREAVIAALTDVEAIIDAIDKYAENYADDDRQDVGVDVRNAFSAGVGYACDLVRARATPTAEEREG